MNKTSNVTVPLLDLRSIFLDMASILSFIGLPLNILLIYLIFFKTDKKLSDYKTILVQNCFVDVFYNIVNEVVKGVSAWILLVAFALCW